MRWNYSLNFHIKIRKYLFEKIIFDLVKKTFRIFESKKYKVLLHFIAVIMISFYGLNLKSLLKMLNVKCYYFDIVGSFDAEIAVF